MDVGARHRVVQKAERDERDRMLADIAKLKAQVNELTLLIFDLLDQTGYKTKPISRIPRVERRRF